MKKNLLPLILGSFLFLLFGFQSSMAQEKKTSKVHITITEDDKVTSDTTFELAEGQELFSNPKHPYTEALMSAVPVPDPDYKAEQIVLEGDVPSPLNPPSGCYFHPRCHYAKRICRDESPIYSDLGDEHFVACHFAESLHLRPIRIGD